MNKPEFYPYVLLPEEIEKIKIEGIPVPEIKELPAFPEKPKKKFLGTAILLFSVVVILLINLTKILKGHYSLANGITFFAFFIAIVSLTAMVFEILHNSKAKKQHRIAIKLYEERKAEREKLKQSRVKAIDDNNNPKAIEAYRLDTISKYFKYSYNKIQAVQHEQTAAHKRFMIFLEQYFEGKILENIRIMHEPKSLDYSPGFLLKLENPKVNIAIDIEEPYHFEGTKVVVKKNSAEDLFKIRYRVTNELRWVSIVFSEEQIVSHPTEACKLIGYTIDEIILKEKYAPKFKGVEKLKRDEIPGQRELSTQIRNKQREKYLSAAGLIDDQNFAAIEAGMKDLASKPSDKLEKDTEKRTKTIEKLEPVQLSDKSEKVIGKDVKLSDKLVKAPEKGTKTPDKSGKLSEKGINIKGTAKEQKNETKKINITKPENEKGKIEKSKVVDLKKDLIKKDNEKKQAIKKDIVNKSKTEEVEQLQIVKKVTDKLRTEKQLSQQKSSKKTNAKRSNQDPGKSVTGNKKEVPLKEKEQELKVSEKTQSPITKKGQLKREANKLNKLYELEKDTKVKVDGTKKEEQKFAADKNEEAAKAEQLQERMKMEKERLEKQKQKHELLLGQRKAKEIEAKRLLEKKKMAEQMVEKELISREKREKERKEKVRLEVERLGKAKKKEEQNKKLQAENDLLSKKKIENERIAKENTAKELAEKKRIEKENLAKEQEEKARLERKRVAKEKAEKELQEKDRLQKKKEEAERKEKEKQDRIRQEKEKQEMDDLQKELDRKAQIAANNKLMEQKKAEIEILVVKKEWDKLLSVCNELTKQYPYWDWPYYRRSTVNGNKGKFAEVLVDCNKALGLNPKFADAFYNRATAKFFLGKYAEAAEDYQKCIDLDYKNLIEAYFNKGLCLQNLNYSKKAHDEFVKAKNLGSSKADDLLKQNYPDG